MRISKSKKIKYEKNRNVNFYSSNNYINFSNN